jgi:hypothetical protein
VKAKAIPEKVEFWFITPKFSSFIPSNFLPRIYNSALIAQDTTKFACEPMGDGCFHPQLGYFEKDKAQDEKLPIENKKSEGGSFADRDTQLVECRQGNFFDIYCGKAGKEEESASPLQVWVDTSSSLKHSDGELKTDQCQRRLLVETMRNVCQQKDFAVHVYNTTKRELDTNSTLCLNKGTNSEDNLIRWVRESKAKKLLIITDIDERTEKIAAFIDEIGAKVKGVGSQPLYATAFTSMSKEACLVLD